MAASSTIQLLFWVSISIGVILEVSADILWKKWSIGGSLNIFLIGLALYFVGSIFWAVSIKFELLSKAVSIFMILNVIIAVLAGIIIFHENLSLVNKIGIIFGIIGLVLIEL